MAEKRRLLIPGGAGYLGARLAQALSNEYEIYVTYRNLSPLRECWLRNTPGVFAVRFDAPQAELPFETPFDAAINLAMPGAKEAQKDPEGSRVQAAHIVKNLASLIPKGLLRRLIHFSTFHVYGPDERRDIFAETDELRPQHPYARNHLVCERILEETGFDKMFLLRPTNIVAAPAHGDLGPQSKLLFLSLCRQMAETGSMRLDNDGLSYRDFVGFDDLLSAVRLLLACPAAPFRVMNVSAGSSYRLNDFAELIHRVAGSGEVMFGTGKDAWRRPFVVCNQRMRSLGWNPQLDMTGEIGKTLEFFSS
jgi:nucleoside-diphosphate-sugar epimerase